MPMNSASPAISPNSLPFVQVECADWEVGAWGECEGECDLGERQRAVSCPPERRCSPDARPPEAEPCELRPCLAWVEGPWSLCTK